MTNQPSAEIRATWIASDLDVRSIDSPFWQSATAVAITNRWSGEVAPPEQHSEARLLWTDEALLVRFVCRQTKPLIVSNDPQFERKTIGLWDRDVCEIFIAPDPNTPTRYFEFEAAPSGEWIDLAINFEGAKRETDFEFDSRMTVFASSAGERLILAMRIPWTDSIPKPEKGDRWRANLFRCVGTGNERYLAWQPTYTEEPNFHVPKVFGWLHFT
jgi:alpha-galactosidase